MTGSTATRSATTRKVLGAAAVVGGVAFSGGRCSLVAAMAGVLLVQFLGSLLLIIGFGVQAQLIIKGLVVIGAVALYSLAERRS